MKTLKPSFSETTRPGALVFGMKHHLVNLSMFVQIIALVQKMAPPGGGGGGGGGHMLYLGLYREQHENIFFSETTRPRHLILGM